MRIAVDAMGGDYAPKALLEGALTAADLHKDWEIILVGNEEALPKEASLPQNVTVELSKTVMAMDESVDNLRKKRDSSIWVATELVKNGRADAVVSAGSTGAQMASALLLLGRIKGILRPAIGITYPTLNGGKIMLDVGANVEVKADQLLQFAYMGAVYSKTLFNVLNPKIRLLSNGGEAGKGTETIVEAHQLLLKSGLNFEGNIEGRDLLKGEYDVVVTDGFTGNVVIKTTEGVASALMGLIKEELTASTSRKLGAALVKPGLKNIVKMLDYSEYGGAPLLGVNGVSIVCHGSSNSFAIQNAIRVAAECVQAGFVGQIAEQIQKQNLKGQEINNQ
jgi:glycerol-3-phosphate acyltransferase PlsX